MKNYICKKPFSVEKVDDDGFMLENEYFDIEKGDRFQASDDKSRMVGGPDTILLESEDRTWLEIPQGMLNEYFEEAPNE